MPLLQVISTSPADSYCIEQNSGDRIELVSALEIGGLTPSNTIIRKSLQCVDIPTMVMVRHHNNGFVYSKQDKILIYQQVANLLDIGVKGIVVGALQYSRQVDLLFMKQIKHQINTNKVDITFHKAIDYSANILKSYQQLPQCGVTRILTQGGELPIGQNINTLQKLVQNSKKQKNPKILLGGGINFQNVNQLLKTTKAEEIHIGTCVRKDKYGPICSQKLTQFINLIKQK